MPTKLLNKMGSNNEQHKDIDLDSILDEIGSFGKYQIYNYVLVFLAIVVSTPFTIAFVFTAGDLNYRCRINGCDNNSSDIYKADFINFTTPYNKNGEFSKCETFSRSANTSDNSCTAQNFDRSNIVRCHDDFVYETDELTIVNDFDIHCSENKWKLALVGTVDTIGQFFALPITGYVSDRYGRRFALVFGFVASGILGLIRSFATSYIFFLTFEFLDPAIGSGIYSSAFILAMEMVGPKYRTFISAMIFAGYGTGEVLLGFLAMATLNWRWLLRITYAPAFLFISYYWILPESFRWLHTANKKEQIVHQIKRAAKINRIVLSKGTVDSIDDWRQQASDERSNTEAESAKVDFRVIFRYPKIVFRVLTLSFIWITNTLCYYGLSLNAVALGGNKFTNFIAVCAIEIPGYFISYFLINRLGRKKSLAGALFICGISSLCNGLIETNYMWTLILFLIGKAAITISFQILYLYTAELFPTNMRHTLLGWCSTFGRFGSMIAPQTPLLESISKSLPILLFGGTAFISGLLTLQYPETLNRKLPDTLEEAVNMGKSQEIKT